MNKIFKVLVGVATLTLGVALLTACNTEKDSNLAVAQVYSFSTVSGAQLNRMSEATLEAEPEVEPETDPIIEDDMDDVNHYVNLLESFISNPIKVSDPVASDLVDDEGNPLYQWMVTYEVVNALGEKDVYEFHYTEEVIYDSTLVVTDDNDEDQDLEWNNNETTLFDIWEEDFKDYYDNFDDFKQNFEGWRNRYQSIYQDFDDFMDDYEDWLDDYQDEFNTFDEWFNYFRNRHRGMR